MVLELEGWARKARNARIHGFPRFSVEAAEIIESYARVFRDAGVPERFPSLNVGRVLGALPMVEVYRKASKELAEILSTVERGEPILTQELATKINQRFGRDIPDDILTESFLFTYPYAMKVDSRVRSTYNRALMPFIRLGYSTLGSIRDADPSELLRASRERRQRIGTTTLTFFQIAFARPQHA